MKKQTQLHPSNMLLTTPYEIKEVYTGKLRGDQPYQRPISPARVSALVKNFNSKLFGEPIVSFRNGQFFTLDGQHRIQAAIQKNNGRDLFIRCKIIPGLTYKQEAELYFQLNEAQKPMLAIDTVRAMVESGEHMDITDIHKVLTANGFAWTSVRGQNHVRTVRAVQSAYSLLGFDSFSRMVCLMREAWNGEADSLTRQFFYGLSLFFKTYPDVTDEAFLHSMKKFPAAQIIRDGNTDISTTDIAIKYARVFLACYNKHQRKKLPYRFEG